MMTTTKSPPKASDSRTAPKRRRSPSSSGELPPAKQAKLDSLDFVDEVPDNSSDEALRRAGFVRSPIQASADSLFEAFAASYLVTLPGM